MLEKSMDSREKFLNFESRYAALALALAKDYGSGFIYLKKIWKKQVLFLFRGSDSIK